MTKPKRTYDTIIIGGGQAGLAMGYYLSQYGRDFVILDASARVGDVWRNRWDSLCLFTPARYCGLPGMPFPAPPDSFPTKDEMADYLEEYATRLGLPVRMGVRVDHLTRQEGRFAIKAGDLRFEADNVIVAMSDWQKPRMPEFAAELDDSIVQLHSSQYQNPSQLQDGGVLVVGAANSGAEIALDVARSHATWLSGKHPGHIPFRIDSFLARLFLVTLVLRVIFHRIMTVKTPFGRKMRVKLTKQGMPLVRTKPVDIENAGIERVPRTTGVRDGLPVLENGRVLDVTNVIWATGFHPGFSWIDLPVFAEGQKPVHERGVVANEPGLYFVGLTFLYAASSSQIHGLDRDVRYVADHIAARSPISSPVTKATFAHIR